MLLNYIKIGLRNLSKHLSLSLINLIGLTLGMASVIIIYLFVQNELSYDKFHQDVDNIYRVAWFSDNPQTRTPHPLAEAMIRDFPEVESAVSLTPIYGPGLTKQSLWIKNPKNNLKYDETEILAVDSLFFDVFSFQLISGNKEQVLREPGRVLISERMAEKYFADEDAVGQMLEVNKEGQFIEVEGIFKDVPDNSHFHFDFLISYVTTKSMMGPDNPFFFWDDFGHYNYVKFKPGANVQSIEAGLMDWVSVYLDLDEQALGNLARNNSFLGLQPLKDIHLKSDIRWELENNGNISYIYIMLTAGLIILIIACFNFINLTTAKSADRANEVGVRKTLGAKKSQLATQFLSETILLSLIASLLAALLVELLLPSFNILTGKQLQFDSLSNGLVIPGLIGLGVLIGIIAGSFPSFYLSQITPIQVIGGKFSKTAKGKLFWKLLVGLQFTLTMFLLAGSFVIFKQLNFLQSKDLGFNKEEVVLVPVKNSNTRNQIETVTTELLNIPGISSVAGSSNVPGKQFNQNPMFLTEERQNILNVSEMRVDWDIFNALDLRLVEGRAFSQKHGTDSAETFVLNETAARQLSPNESIIGKLVILDADGTLMEGTVIGVVKDFNFESLHRPVGPLAIQLLPFYNTMLIRVNTAQLPETIDGIKATWQKFEPNNTFSYSFLNERISAQYGNEKKMGTVFGIFSAIAITLSCLGMFGLATLSFVQRTKEVGVRKVLGASILGIMLLLVADFSWIIILAIVVAIPTSMYIMSEWLTNFSYRITIGLWPMASAALVTILVAWGTISYLTWTTAQKNPVVSLRDE